MDLEKRPSPIPTPKSKQNEEYEAVSKSCTIVKPQSQKGCNVPNTEILQRMNYLLQIALQQREAKNMHLANFYLQQLVKLSHKMVLRVNSRVKQFYCKKCLLFYDERTSVGKSGGKAYVEKKCQKCKRTKKLFLAQK